MQAALQENSTQDTIFEALKCDMPTKAAKYLMDIYLLQQAGKPIWRPAVRHLVDEIGGVVSEVLPGNKKFQGPTMLIAGEKSLFTCQLSQSAGTLEEIYEPFVSNLKVMRVPDAGHMLHLQRPREIADAIDFFISSSSI